MEAEKYDVVIIGAGFAGAATAFHLSEIYRGSILIVEREEVPGVHASGRNAGLILQFLKRKGSRDGIGGAGKFGNQCIAPDFPGHPAIVFYGG